MPGRDVEAAKQGQTRGSGGRCWQPGGALTLSKSLLTIHALILQMNHYFPFEIKNSTDINMGGCVLSRFV